MRYPCSPTWAANIGRYVGELTRWQSAYGEQLRTIQDKTNTLDRVGIMMARRPHPQYRLIMYLAVMASSSLTGNTLHCAARTGSSPDGTMLLVSSSVVSRTLYCTSLHELDKPGLPRCFHQHQPPTHILNIIPRGILELRRSRDLPTRAGAAMVRAPRNGLTLRQGLRLRGRLLPIAGCQAFCNCDEINSFSLGK